MPRIVHFEIPATDPDRAVKFYTDTFGWEIKKWDGPQEYWLVRTGEDAEPGINGGIYRQKKDDECIANTIGVVDIEEYARKVKENGGKIIGEIMDLPGVGRFAAALDTEGKKFSLMQMFPDAKMM